MYLCFKINSFFSPKALLDAMFPVIAMQRFDLKNSTIANKQCLVMILNLHLTSE